MFPDLIRGIHSSIQIFFPVISTLCLVLEPSQATSVSAPGIPLLAISGHSTTIQGGKLLAQFVSRDPTVDTQ